MLLPVTPGFSVLEWGSESYPLFLRTWFVLLGRSRPPDRVGCGGWS